MTTRFEESLQRDIDRIRHHVTEMSRLAERALRDCVTALVDGNRQLAYAVILRDQFIDEKEKEIDRLCLEFIARQQPVAGPLRLAYSTIKINIDLERVGDYAESIARHILKLDQLPAVVPKDRIVEMANLAIPMLGDAIRAFVQQDAALAQKTIAVEETVDGLRSKVNAELVRLFREQKLTYETLDPLLTIVRRFERVSDQARNICMEVLYMCTGAQAKHPGAEAFRILFVDEHNSCRSQMAEAIAQALNQPRFIFNSAGMEPRPLEPATVEFMKAKGFDLAREAPKALFQVPNLDHYQVIVALTKEAHRAFPQRPRKVVFLDWPVPDPSQVQGTPAQVQAAFEETFQFIQRHVQELVAAIVGAKVG